MKFKQGNKKMKARRYKIWTETNGRCVYCNQITPEDERTKDHLQPKSHGGGNHSMNFVPACKSCNEYRGDRLPAWRFAHSSWISYVRYKEENQVKHAVYSLVE